MLTSSKIKGVEVNKQEDNTCVVVAIVVSE